MVEIDAEDMALRLWFQGDLLRARLILDGELVHNILKRITFKDPHKELKRKLYLERKQKKILKFDKNGETQFFQNSEV